MNTAVLSTGYVVVEPELRLPAVYQAAEDVVRRFDPELRLRQSLRKDRRAAGCGYVLERKTRYEKPTHTATVRDAAGNLLRVADPDVRVASRDGYLIIDHVHATLLMRPEAIVERLKDGDLAKQRWQERWDEIVDQIDTEKRKRQAARHGDNKAKAREGFDVLDRIGGVGGTERTRISNPGVETPFTVTDRRRVTAEGCALDASSAGEIPAQEISDEHSPSAPRGGEDRRLHGESGA